MKSPFYEYEFVFFEVDNNMKFFEKFTFLRIYVYMILDFWDINNYLKENFEIFRNFFHGGVFRRKTSPKPPRADQ